jgi:N4-(beta-N-acetylglucosaminyl)-L-asparaginase
MVVGSTTSGLAFKMHGRVGDSPIIGAGLYVEKGIGGAVCTGLGEALIKTVGANSIVEAMRYGQTPQQACDNLIKRLIDKIPGSDNY